MRETEAARLLALQRQAREERDAWVRQTTQAVQRLRSQGTALRAGAGTLAWALGVALAVRVVWRGLTAVSGRSGSGVGSGGGARQEGGVIRGLLRWGRRASALLAAVRLLAPQVSPGRPTSQARDKGSLSGRPPTG